MFDAEHHDFLSSHCCVNVVLWEKALPLPKDQSMKNIYPVYNTVGQGINFKVSGQLIPTDPAGAKEVSDGL